MYGLLKSHNGIMKSDAIADYDKVKNYCIEQGFNDIIVEPKGKSWQKIEDATAKMLRQLNLSDGHLLALARGYKYYMSI